MGEPVFWCDSVAFVLSYAALVFCYCCSLILYGVLRHVFCTSMLGRGGQINHVNDDISDN